jgi:hypothetical protein
VPLAVTDKLAELPMQLVADAGWPLMAAGELIVTLTAEEVTEFPQAETNAR